MTKPIHAFVDAEVARQPHLSLGMELDLERFRHARRIARPHLLYTSHHSTIAALIRRGLIEEVESLSNGWNNPLRVYGLTEQGREVLEQRQKRRPQS